MNKFKRANPADLQAQLEALNTKSSFDKQNENEWKLDVDPTGNGHAVIRFLPAKPDQENAVPFVKLYSHGFKLPSGNWYIENCPTTIGLECPACEYNKELWNGTEEDKKVASKQKRRTNYYANVLIIKDPSNPDNNGKVKIFRFGQKIMDKIIAQSQGDADLGTPAQDVTCVFSGSNFILKTKKVSGYANYDDSKFGPPSEIENINDEAFANQLISQMHDIMSYIDPSKFKSYEELQKKLFDKMKTTKTMTAAEELSGADTMQSYQAQTVANGEKSRVGSIVTDEELEALLNG